MNATKPFFRSMAAVGTMLSLFAQEPAEVVLYEDSPVLNASELLKPEFYKGPYHEVMGSVPTKGFANQYTLQTSWGPLTVHGNEMLLKRVMELDAVAQLDQASKSDKFKESLRKAAATPLKALGGALQDPAKTAKGIGSGAARLFKRAGEAFERGGKKSANTDSTIESLVGFSKSKREIARSLKVDPYSSNPILQQKLDEMARASFAGGFVVKAGTFALASGANVGAASVAQASTMSSDVANMVHDNGPLDLSRLNRERLIALGVTEADADLFVENPIPTPTQQTALTSSLVAIGAIQGIQDFLVMTNSSRSAQDVDYFVSCASMLAEHHLKVSPLTQIFNLHGLPTAYTKNTAMVIPLAVDYASWSPEAERLTKMIAAYDPGIKVAGRTLLLAGRASVNCRTELKKMGFTLAEESRAFVYKK